MKSLYPYRFIIILAALALLVGMGWFYSRRPLTPRVQIRDAVFTVSLAVTPAEHERGLGYRDTLPRDQGMLFLFRDKAQRSFWMKGMRFPLDIIWILDNTVVDITHNAPVASGGEIPSFVPRQPVNKVLEINAGLASQYGIQVGDTITVLR